MKAFLRLAAVLVGLANLGILVLVGILDYSSPRSVIIMWDKALLPVLTAVIAGLVTSQLALRWFERQFFAERFSDRYAVLIWVVCLGGMLMGGLLAAALTLDRTLVQGPLTLPGRILATAFTGMLGASLGFILGMVEGLLLAFPMATILGLFKGRG